MSGWVADDSPPDASGGALGDVAARLTLAHVWRYRTAQGRRALLAEISALLPLLAGQGSAPATGDAAGAGDRVLLVEPTLDDALVRDLLTGLVGGALPPGPPQWGALVTRQGSRSRNPLARYRGSGPFLRTALRGADIAELAELDLACELFPLTLTAVGSRPASLAAPEKRPEGDDTLERRGDWFRDRSGQDD